MYKLIGNTETSLFEPLIFHIIMNNITDIVIKRLNLPQNIKLMPAKFDLYKSHTTH